MQKTRLGISVGLMGFITYFACYFGGYLAAILLFGYILLVENNQWLRKTAVKALLLTVAFSLLSALIGLIPDVIDFIGSIVNVFNGSFYLTIVSKIVTVLTSAIGLIKTVLFIILGIKALSQGSITVPVVDDLTNKNTD